MIKICNLHDTHSYLHEEHELDDRDGPNELTEGVDEQVKGQQCELDEQHQRVVISLEHLCSDLNPHSNSRIN